MRLLLSLSGIVGIVGLASTPAQAADDAGVNALYGRLAGFELSQNVAELDAVYTPDAVYLGPGQRPAVGREAIKSLFKRPPGISTKVRLVQRIWHGEDSVTDIGYGMLWRTNSDGSKKTAYSKFVTLALRQPDGSWRWRVDIDNALVPDAAEAEFDALKPVENLRYDQ